MMLVVQLAQAATFQLSCMHGSIVLYQPSGHSQIVAMTTYVSLTRVLQSLFLHLGTSKIPPLSLRGPLVKYIAVHFRFSLSVDQSATTYICRVGRHGSGVGDNRPLLSQNLRGEERIEKGQREGEDRKMNRQTDRPTDRQTERQTDRQTDRQIDR